MVTQNGVSQPQAMALNFESESNTFDKKSNLQSEVQKDAEIEEESPFSDIIGQCFLPYLYVYINSVDR